MKIAEIKILDKAKDFISRNAMSMDRALNAMAIDIEILSKEQVPTRKGHLGASGTHRKAGFLDYRVEYNKRYARFQEFGGDKKRVVRHYTKPGTKKFYLKDPGNTIAGRALQYFQEAARSIKV